MRRILSPSHLQTEKPAQLASYKATTGRVLANFRQVVKEGDLRLHPLIGKLLDKETLAKMTQPDPAEKLKKTDP